MSLTKPIVLASQSPRRKQLLEQAGIPFEIKVVPTDEDFPPGLPIPEIPVYIARNKALAVKAILSQPKTILAADTVVVLHGKIIGKPKDREDAINILSALSGQSHEVITGVVLLDGEKERSFEKTTKVHFLPISKQQIEYYVDHFKPYDKAGAYAIQEWIGAVAIDSIEGCFYNVMGLPVSEIVKLLKL